MAQPPQALKMPVVENERFVSEAAPDIGLQKTNAIRQITAPTVQRLPTGQEIRERSTPNSNESGILKKSDKYELVIGLVNQYNQVIDAVVDEEPQKRQETFNALDARLNEITDAAKKYLAKHATDTKREQTNDSFKRLLDEVELEKTALTTAFNRFDNTLLPDQTWKESIAAALRGIGGDDPELVQVALDTKLPVSYLVTLPEGAVGLLIWISKQLRDRGDKAEIGRAFTKLGLILGTMPGGAKTFSLIRAQMQRPHLQWLNPTLNDLLQKPDFQQEDVRGMKGENAIHAGSADISPQQHLGFYEQTLKHGQNDMRAIHAKYGKAIGRPEEEFVKQQLGRQAWEKKYGKAKHFTKLKSYEQKSLAVYSKDYWQFNNPLRGDITDYGQPTNPPQEGHAGADPNSLNDGRLAMVENLVSGLNRLKPVKATVYRHDTSFPGFLELNREGITVSDMAPLSTTRDANSLKKIEGSAEPDVLSVIESKTGKFFKPISHYNKFSHDSTDENEVLFKPGTKFRIVKRYDRKQLPNGTIDFPEDMDGKAKSALNADIRKADIKVILVKEEV